MIVPMNKITLLVTNQSRENALKELRKFGAVHVTALKNISSEEGIKLEDQIQAIQKTIDSLPEKPEHIKPVDKPVSEIVEEILELQNKKDKINQEKEALLTELGWFSEWGETTIASIRKIQESGLYIRFYKVPKNFVKTLPQDKEIFTINQGKNTVNIVLVTKTPDDHLSHKEDHIPEKELDEIKSSITNCDNEIKKVDTRLLELSANRVQLKELQTKFMKKLEFDQVKTGMKKEETFSYLQGFIPQDSANELKNEADKNGWAYIIDEPTDEDDVPTHIKNPKWLNIVKPVFSFMGTVPGYKEIDISFWFSIFFSIFVGILIGDAGYGCLFLGMTLFAHFKARKAKNKELIYLMYILSSTIIGWGTLSGTWFGVEEFSRIPFLQQFIIPQIASFDVTSGFSDNQNFIIGLCLLIGAIHLTIAHLIQFVRRIKFLNAISHLGWICILWASYFVAELLILGNPLPELYIEIIKKNINPTLYLLAIGIPLALFFSFEGKFSLKSLISVFTIKLFPFVFDVIGAFADVVSYLRLFAVGLASVIVANSFNALAIGAGVTGIGTAIKAILIMIGGHTLNIVLGAMSVIVHGLRLNLLEFSGHLGMEWSGHAYKPFKE